MKKRLCVLLALVMAVSLIAGMLATSAFAAEEPAPIQDTYVVDGVTYFNTGSNNFSVDPKKFYKDLLSTRTSLLAYHYRPHYNADDDVVEATYDQSTADLWLRLGACMLEDLPPARFSVGDMHAMDEAAVRGVGRYNDSASYYRSATRYDMVSQMSLKDAEEWVFRQTFGTVKDFGYFKENTDEQYVLVTALGEYENAYGHRHALGAYFTNFRVIAAMPADEGSNYVTEMVSDSINSESTIASTVKNLTASTVTGSQTVSNSTTATVSSSVNGSRTYSYTEGIKIGAEYKFTEKFKVNGELSFSATQAFAHGWGTGDSLSDTKSVSYTVSVPLAPYTRAMLTQTDTTTVYLTHYNCPIALLYDVTLVFYDDDGILHASYTIPNFSRDMVFHFTDAAFGARGDLFNRNAGCEGASDWDRENIRWRRMDDLSEHYYSGTDARETLRTHVPMAPTGASFLQTLNVIANEVSGLMPTHPLYRVKIADPGTGGVTESVDYGVYHYFTTNMEVGDFSYTNYMSIVGYNKYDAPFYGFSKDNGYWEVVDRQGNPFSEADSPVKLEKDPVSTNWRYTAVRPGSCFLVYRIDEDAYYIADKPDQPIRNSDLKKTAALEVIVTEADPTDAIVITGSYQGHPNVDPETLESEGKLTVAVYDETGKEIEKPYTWEAKELRGISVTPDGQVTFTKDGIYHVRAVNGKLRSDWYEITAGHTPADVVQENAVAPTCTGPGSCDLVSYCEVCGEELSREHVEEPALGHNFDAGTVTQEPTTAAEGVLTCTCVRCGETETQSVPKLPTEFRIIEQPESISATVGDTVIFQVAAEGEELTYQWQYKTPSGTWKNSPAAGNRTETLSIPATVSRDGYQYRCIVKSGDETLTSEAAKLTVFGIKTQPKSISAAAGENVTFRVTATGENLTYQWQYKTPSGAWKNSPATGSRTDTLTVPATVARNGYQYRCVVKSSGDTLTSNAAALNVFGIKTQPKSVTADKGGTAVFKVTAAGDGLTYQWQYLAPNGSWKNSPASGNKTDTLTIPATAWRNGYQYRCIVRDSGGNTVTSNAAKITVK